MTTSEIREQLKQIQSELKKPFPAAVHEVRELPGGDRKWVFLKWQTIRERLDEVCPEWVIDYSEVQYMGNDAICRCGITILGVRKEAIASVPISIISSKGKEMTRGSAADRLAAEGLKNASEAWGVGRYLDDQEFTIRYLWERMKELDDETAGDVRKLAYQYKLDRGMVAPRPKQDAEPSQKTISEGQAKRLWAIAKNELRLDDQVIKDVYKGFGFEKTEYILSSKYEEIIEQLRVAAERLWGRDASEIATTVDRKLLMQEISSLMKRKSVTAEYARRLASEWMKVSSCEAMSDAQLVQFRDRLSVLTPVTANVEV
jgi:hypothetical protein